MNPIRLPTKLGKEPLIEVVFELRFEAKGLVSGVLPGILFAKLGGGERIALIERLAPAELPEVVRANDPNLKFAPLIRLNWAPFAILVGDRNVAVACHMPYPGWAKFREAILEVVRGVISSSVIQRVTRYSLKYIDLIQKPSIADQVKCFNWAVSLGTHQLKAEAAILRIEILRHGAIHAVQVLTGAQVQAPNSPLQSGAVIDIDSICNVDEAQVEQFADGLASRIDDLHASNKQIFFECLTPAIVQELNPSYE